MRIKRGVIVLMLSLEYALIAASPFFGNNCGLHVPADLRLLATMPGKTLNLGSSD
jgi:hypothetical protein